MASDGRRSTNVQKAASVVVALGAEYAAQVYRFLSEDEIEQISFEIARMDRRQPEDMQTIIEDFYGLCVTQKVIAEGGVEYARSVLEKAFGQQQALSFMERVAKSLRTKAFEFVRKADYKNLLSILQGEHPQTVALVLSYARSDQAAQIIAELPPERRIEVVERIAKLDRASPEVISIVEKTLQKKFDSIVSVDLMELGGVNYVADIMNHVDRGTEKFVFDELTVRDSQLASDIRKLMFVFEDIGYLDDMSVQRFIRDVDSRDLAVALKRAPSDVEQMIFRNMSGRMQETIRSDIEYLHNVRMRDVEDAQQRIVDVIRRLEEEGELVITKGGKDEMIV